jgi:hypothetical protein
MAKVLIVTQDGFDDPIGYTFKCPGCGDYHCFYVQDPGTPYRGGTEPWPIWTFVNGDIDKPTFRASMLHRLERKDQPTLVCHSFVTDGNIQFLGDCTHALANQTVELPEVE